WMRQRIGIDPTGGTDPNSPNIAWSLPAQLTQWGQLAVEVAATSEQVTVFLAADPDKERPFNDIYYDDATLSLVAFPAPTAQPLPAPTVDPLVIGLVDGAGAAPGTQGIRVSESNNTNHSLFIDKLVLLGALGAIWASVLIVSYFFSAHKRKRF
ncbi:MAG: hypothetical protein GY803_24795, partial [Chloroflexi bacterium]|nr:hypothetical protein [Chloroflexota bacterium]